MTLPDLPSSRHGSSRGPLYTPFPQHAQHAPGKVDNRDRSELCNPSQRCCVPLASDLAVSWTGTRGRQDDGTCPAACTRTALSRASVVVVVVRKADGRELRTEIRCYHRLEQPQHSDHPRHSNPSLIQLTLISRIPPRHPPPSPYALVPLHSRPQCSCPPHDVPSVASPFNGPAQSSPDQEGAGRFQSWTLISYYWLSRLRFRTSSALSPCSSLFGLAARTPLTSLALRPPKHLPATASFRSPLASYARIRLPAQRCAPLVAFSSPSPLSTTPAAGH